MVTKSNNPFISLIHLVSYTRNTTKHVQNNKTYLKNLLYDLGIFTPAVHALTLIGEQPMTTPPLCG